MLCTMRGSYPGPPRRRRYRFAADIAVGDRVDPLGAAVRTRRSQQQRKTLELSADLAAIAACRTSPGQDYDERPFVTCRFRLAPATVKIPLTQPTPGFTFG
jgi:hypothetical protein